MKITALAYSRPEDDPKHRKNPDAVRPAPSPLGLAALSVGGGGSSGSSSSGITVGTTTVTSGTAGRVLYTTSGNVVGSAPINVNALNSTYLDVASAASGAGLTLTVAGGGTNENLKLVPKGTGQVLVPDGAAATPGWAYASAPGLGSYNIANVIHGWTVAGSLVATLSSSVLNVSSATGQIILGSDVGLTRHASGVARLLSGASTTAGQLLIGTSTDTADAQLSVYSQSTTRPVLKLRALSGTAATQNVFESYDASGVKTASISSGGTLDIVTIRGSGGAGTGVAGITVANANTVNWVNGSYLFGGATTGAVTGAFRLVGSGSTTALNFGGDTSSCPTLKRSSTSIAVRLADDSDDAPLTTLTVKTKALTVATLPAAATAGAGARCFVTDANATTFLSTVAGGGANAVPVVSDGTNWLIG